jgi:hypothetical protein
MFPNDRDGGYDADKVYDTSASVWIAQSAQLPKSGEKYTWIIVIGRTATDATIYIGKM